MIVLDTHVLIWWASGNRERLSPTANEAVRAALESGSVFVSSITAWELAVLVRSGRLDLTVTVSEWLDHAGRIRGLSFVPVDNTIAVGSLELPGEFHDDPADRIIAATSLKLSASLVTADEKIRRYPYLRTIW